MEALAHSPRTRRRPTGKPNNEANLTNLSTRLVGKRLEMLVVIAPNSGCVAVLRDPGSGGGADATDRAKADSNGQRERAGNRIAAIAQPLLVMSAPVYVLARAQPAEFAARHGIPASYDNRQIVAAAGLMSGPDTNDMVRRAASYVDKILKGANPGDLPIEQPTKFELVINLKTAKALGLPCGNRSWPAPTW